MSKISNYKPKYKAALKLNAKYLNSNKNSVRIIFQGTVRYEL